MTLIFLEVVLSCYVHVQGRASLFVTMANDPRILFSFLFICICSR